MNIRIEWIRKYRFWNFRNFFCNINDNISFFEGKNRSVKALYDRLKNMKSMCSPRLGATTAVFLCRTMLSYQFYIHFESCLWHEIKKRCCFCIRVFAFLHPGRNKLVREKSTRNCYILYTSLIYCRWTAIFSGYYVNSLWSCIKKYKKWNGLWPFLFVPLKQ